MKCFLFTLLFPMLESSIALVQSQMRLLTRVKRNKQNWFVSIINNRKKIIARKYYFYDLYVIQNWQFNFFYDFSYFTIICHIWIIQGFSISYSKINCVLKLNYTFKMQILMWAFGVTFSYETTRYYSCWITNNYYYYYYYISVPVY